MIRSMTAYAACEAPATGGVLSCELRAVNHRYLELSIRAPEELRAIEPAVRERIAARLARGKLELGFRYRPSSEAAGELRLNTRLLGQLASLYAQVSPQFPGLQAQFTELLRYPGVVEEDALDSAGLQAEALALLERSLDEFVQAREREGANLAAAMRERLDGIERITAQIRQWLPEIRSGLRARLEAKLAEFKQPLDPGRLEQEIVLGLQKLDVDEELDRLRSHIGEMRRILATPDAVGRRLDFLLQEFNREANTLGSKSVDPRTSNAAVELKVLIEQLREQVQNLE